MPQLARSSAGTGLNAAPSREVSLSLTKAVPGWFYKKGCQEKKLSRELEAANSFGIQPLATVQVLEA
jgi:hypothetical protein